MDRIRIADCVFIECTLISFTFKCPYKSLTPDFSISPKMAQI